MPHADCSKDRANWLVVIPTKPRARVDQQYTLPTTYQQMDMTTIVKPMNDVIPASFVDESASPEEVNDEIGLLFIQSNDEIDEVENDEGDQQGEWDDGNKTDGVEENLHSYDDDDDDDDDEDIDDDKDADD